MSLNPGRPPAISHALRLGRKTRATLAMLALGLVGVLVTARALRPDPKGFGTHTQLGLGACAFREITGKPCPACGMTTAFSWCARGRLDLAWRANPAGSVIAPVLLAMLAWLIVASTTGKTWPFRTPDAPLVGVVLLGMALALTNWAVRLLWLLR